MKYIFILLKRIIKYIITLSFKINNFTSFKIKTGLNSYILSTKTNIRGKNNRLIIGNNVKLNKCNFHINGSNNKIIIHNNTYINNATFWIEDNFNYIIINKNCSFHGNIQLAACESTYIKIGKECMFSHDIFLRTTDSHAILYKGKRINQAKNIQIGNKVWIGMQTIILKGANIPDGCIIGARSTITNSIMKSNSIYAGSPAKLIKDDIFWTKQR